MEVKFWPRKDFDVQICDIKDDRDAVIVQHSDTFQYNTSWYVEALGFKYGIKPCAFASQYFSVGTGLGEVFDSGVMKFGVYMPTDRYVGADGISRTLPDYAATAYTAAGAAYYGVQVEQEKAAGYPAPGQQIYDLTNGAKGYNVVTGTPGADGNMDYIRQAEAVKKWYFEQFGRYPSAGADRQGKPGSPELYPPFYLGARSTNVNGNTSYGKSKSGKYLGSPALDIDRVGFIRKNITSRYDNAIVDTSLIPQYNQLLINGINNAFTYKGMFNDFVHWQRAVALQNDLTLLYNLYDLIYTTVNGRNAWYTGFGEAIEYMWYREMTSRAVGTVKGDKLYVALDFVDHLKGVSVAGIPMKILYDTIKTPLSVKVDLSGTFLAGKHIKTSFGKPISKGNNVYILEVPFGFEVDGIKGISISEVATPDYKDFSLPVVTTSRSGNILTVETIRPTKCVLFKGTFETTIDIVSRSNTYSVKHTIQITTGESYLLGVISHEEQTALISI